SLNSRLRPDFANLLFRERTMVSQYLVCSKGVGSIQRNLYWPHLKRVTAVLPPLEEQAAIVRFLGYANGRIQRYIQAKKKLIKLLEEQKRAIIHRAVTQGVNPGARLKPSGVEWLGDVPEHWEVRRLKTLFREVNKRSETGTETLLSLRMHQGLVPHEDVSDKPIPPSALVGYKHVVPGQLVMNRMRAAIGIFGVPTQAGLVSPDYAVFVPASTVVPSYYLSLFKTEAMCSEFRLASKGLGTGSSGFMRLYTDQFGRLWVPLPPLDEQEEILRAIEVESSEIESALSVARREVELLREYRSRLIADVVTGQLDVREAASNLPDSLIHPEEMDIEAEDSGDEFDEDEGVEN
ncbi:MAG: restriction endonuclease subunit S, partial [Polyangiaceae bacterium]